MRFLPRCKTCAHYSADVEIEGRRGKDGDCHRYAPRPLVGGSGQGWSDWEWPSVNEDDFCGEWHPMIKATP